MINKESTYVIVKPTKNGKEYFNNRVYKGKYVMMAYKQIKNKQDYFIEEILPVVDFRELYEDFMDMVSKGASDKDLKEKYPSLYIRDKHNLHIYRALYGV